jgi:hypothetical protein
MRMDASNLSSYYKAFLCYCPEARDYIEQEIQKPGGTQKFSRAVLLNPGSPLCYVAKKKRNSPPTSIRSVGSAETHFKRWKDCKGLLLPIEIL